MIHKGELTATLDPATITPRQLGSYMTGSEQDDAETASGPEAVAAPEGPGDPSSGDPGDPR